MFLRNSKFIISFIFSILFLIGLPAFALTLDQALQIAKERNPELKQAERLLKAAQTETIQKSWLNQPDLMLNYQQIPQLSLDPSRAQMSMYGFSQLIPLPNKLYLKHTVAWNKEQMLFYLNQKVFWEIRARVIAAYFKVSYALQKVKINQSNLEILERFKKVSEAKYVVGKASQADLLSAQIEYELFYNNQKTYEDELGLARTELQKLLNKDDLLEIESNPHSFSLNLDQKEIVKKALLNNPGLKAMEFKEKAAADSFALSQAGYLPDFKTTLMQRQVSGVSAGWDLTLSLEAPLWLWTKVASVNQVGYEREAVEADYLDFKNEIKPMVEEIIIKLDTAVRTEKLYRESIVSKAEQSVEAAETAYQADRIDFLALLNTQKMLFNARLVHYKNAVDMQIYKARLEGLIGHEL